MPKKIPAERSKSVRNSQIWALRDQALSCNMSTQKTSHDVEEVITCSKPSMGASNIICALLNLFSMLCSMPCMGTGVWLATGHGSACLQIVKWPLIAVGVFLFVFSLIGIIGALIRNKFLLWFYLAVVFLIVITLLGAVAFAYAVTRGSGEPVNGKAYEDYYLSNYSNWMQHELRMQGLWGMIKNCIESENVCQKLSYTDVNTFFNADLSPLQSGCCKPPTACNFKFVNASYWIPTWVANSDNYTDCYTWSNDPSKLCYECDSCRAGVAEDSQRQWSKMALSSAGTLIYMIVNWAVGSCAASDGKSRYYERRKVTTSSTKDGDSGNCVHCEAVSATKGRHHRQGQVMTGSTKNGDSENCPHCQAVLATKGRQHRQGRGRVLPLDAEQEMAPCRHCHRAGNSEPEMAHFRLRHQASMPGRHGQHPEICMVCANH